jgi:hypothetical protein
VADFIAPPIFLFLKERVKRSDVTLQWAYFREGYGVCNTPSVEVEPFEN